jgi:predicted regulator of Ras-like GTPase activity (Roadblock/LC7/MglB family)
LVSEGWPEPVRREIETCDLRDAKLEVPFEVLEEGLKAGRLHFRWKQLCQWLNPPPPPSMTSASLNTQMDYRVDLPLNFVAPLYLQYRSAPGARKTPSLADIPDVFSAIGQPAAVPVAAAPPASAPVAPAATSAPRPARASAARGTHKPGEELAELFGEPDKRNWTPNDIVHKTTTLPGVAGALIALQDGLLVASCMPPTWKTETIAAFLPQIFGRMKQYTNELKMGELQSVAFSVESGTFLVFNAGIIYFAILSHLEAQLPLPELTLIVTEIGRHTR